MLFRSRVKYGLSLRSLELGWVSEANQTILRKLAHEAAEKAAVKAAVEAAEKLAAARPDRKSVV